MRRPILERIIDFFAQYVERMNILGIQESISDMLEIISDEIGKQIGKTKEEIKEKKNQNKSKKYF